MSTEDNRAYWRLQNQRRRERSNSSPYNRSTNQRQHVFQRPRAFFKCGIQGSTNYFVPEKFYLGPLSKRCIHCGAVFWAHELASMCCHNGKLSHLPTANPSFPTELRDLFQGSDRNSKNFREFIRSYNNANAFASMGAKVENMPNGVYCYKVSGEVYHSALTDIPLASELDDNNALQPPNISYSELFFYDTDTAAHIRMQHPLNAACLRQIMTSLSVIISNVSPYASLYRQLQTTYNAEKQYAQTANIPMRHVSLVFTRLMNDDRRVYNAPTNTNDVALVYVCNRQGEIPAALDFAVYPNDRNQRTIKRLSFFSRHLDPMLFPVFFPNGDPGWTPNMLHREDRSTRVRNKITPLQFYAHKLAIRPGEFNPLFLGGKLFQQYLVFVYARIEAVRLHFIRHNQSTFRVESYRGLMDHLNSTNRTEGPPGNVYILPSSFVGGPRFMSKLYQDTMAMVRKFGRPDLFITFTCNPRWPEILQELAPGQTAADRPDLVTRVFHLKLKELIDDITKKNIFGIIVSYFYTIEFQKRGLPHAHCLFTLRSEDKLRTADDVDNIISAELPDQSTSPDLFNIILRHNIHGPCGAINPSCVCMIDGKCSKSFPKKFSPETQMNVDSYPIYRRRPPRPDTNITTAAGHPIDNRSVVPYNPFLSCKYDAHINVELCSTVKAIKYIHKYVTKGPDYARIGLQTSSENANNSSNNYDEIRQFLNCRYISSQEAAWHIQELAVHGQSHSVFNLSLHLEQGQAIFFHEDSEEDALRRASVRNTTLTAFFELNRTDSSAHQYLYQEIPKHFKFENNKWIRRSERSRFGEKTIGRIVAVSPRDSELYHFRLLLLHVKGNEALSFQSLKEYQRVSYATYKQAALERGLVNDSLEWCNCLQEASEYMLPKAFRLLFVIILGFCSPANPDDLFERFKNHLIEDYIRRGYDEPTALRYCLEFMDQECKQLGFDLSSKPSIVLPNESLPPIILSSFNNSSDPNLWDLLNPEQLEVATHISSSLLNEDDQRCFYVDGPGGCGKTFIYRCLIQKFTDSKKFLCVAWTGIAAILLPGGMTAHSAFSLPLNLSEVKFPAISRQKRELLKNIDCLIWDEAPMALGTALEIVDLLFRDIMRNNLPFGGKIVILGGDFRQVLPVIPKGNRISIVNSTIKKSDLWSHFRIYKLTINMRAITDPAFCNWVLSIGNATATCPIPLQKTGNSVIVPNIHLSNDIVTDVFGTAFTENDLNSIAQRVILCPKNEHVHFINEKVLARLNTESTSYTSIDSVESDSFYNDPEIQLPTEFLNSLNPSGLPQHKLTLKKGCIIMLLRNLSIKNGLCNGTRLVVLSCRPNLIQARIVTGAHAGSVHFIPRISLDTKNDPAISFNLIRHQFPIRLAYAMTINKSQGQTFQNVGLYLPEACFTHGQFYTAISRATSSSSIKIQILSNSQQAVTENGGITNNIVFSEVLE